MNHEQKINKLLQITLKTYFALKKRGKNEEAIIVLQMGSAMAETLLSLNKIKSYKVYCPICKKRLINGEEISFMNSTGECLACSHIRSDVVSLFCDD